MPNTIANWFSETIRPRIGAGEISAMYIGELIEAAPTPMPPSKRKATNQNNVGGSAVPMAETRNSTAAISNILRRPK